MEEDSNTFLFYFAGIICVAVNFMMLNKFYFTPLGRKMTPKYESLEPGKRRLWDTYIASTIHSLIAASCSIYFLLFDQHMYNYPHGPADSKFKFVLVLSAGYFLYDMVVVIRSWRMFGKWSDLTHHFISFIGACYVIVTSRAAYITCLQLFHEFSTPFVNVRWFMLTSGVDKTKDKYKAVSLCMLLAFFVCRIATIPLFWMNVYPDCFHGDAFCNVPEIKILFLVFFGLDILNLYWFKLMLRILFNVIKEKFSKTKKGAPVSDQNGLAHSNDCKETSGQMESESTKKKL